MERHALWGSLSEEWAWVCVRLRMTWNTRKGVGSLRAGVGRGVTGQVGGPLAKKHACRLTGETTKGSWPSSGAFLVLSPDSLQEGRKGSGWDSM